MVPKLIRKNGAAIRFAVVNRVSIECSSLDFIKSCDTAVGGAANNTDVFDYYLLLYSSIPGGTAYVMIDTRVFWTAQGVRSGFKACLSDS
jgi:hypothetical protein